MKILALDTCGERLLACRYGEGKTLTLSLKAAARQDVLLDKALARLLPKGDGALDVIAVGTGPGRFTGIRIGVAFAVVLGKTLKVPVAGFRGLESLAFQASLGKGAPSVVCAALHSIRDEYFWGLFRIDGPGVVAALGEERWSPRADMEKTAHDAGARLYEGPLKAETLARRVEALLGGVRPLPAAEPYYLKPGNYEKR